ncbi:MAG: tyrosinase family protein [Bacteroidota bacterium]
MNQTTLNKNNWLLLVSAVSFFTLFFACDTTKKVVKTETAETLASAPAPSINTAPFVGGGIADSNGQPLRVKHVRKNAHKDTENMKILEEAMRKMKELPCTDPMSWYAQGALHGAPRPGMEDNGGEIFNGNIFCDSLEYVQAENEAWHNCTHGAHRKLLDLNWDESRLHFYSWHKMYLNHFEEVIRYVSGKPDFSLPYWEYDNPSYQTLPKLLIDKNSSLYEAYRNDSLNQGRKIATSMFNDTKNCVTNLTNPENAFEASSFESFTIHLENVPHNVMHRNLGTYPTAKNPDPIGRDSESGYMMNMYSPMDPVFWIHHANIDRLYEKWLIQKIDDELANGGRPTKQEFMERKWVYKFYQPGAKKLTHYDDDLVAVFDDMYGVQNYAYDMLLNDGSYNRAYEDKVATAIELGTWDEDEFPEIDILVASNDEDMNVPAEPTTIITVGGLGDFTCTGTEREVWLLRVDVKFAKIPTGYYNVYIQDQRDTSIACTRATAGIMTFFGAGHNHGIQEAGHEDHPTGNIQETHFHFDVTNEVDFNNFSGNLRITVKPSDTEEEITLDKIQLIKQITSSRIVNRTD